MSDFEEIDTWQSSLPPTKKERVKAMYSQLLEKSPNWGRLPADISSAVVKSVAVEMGWQMDIANRKRDGINRVWVRLHKEKN